MAYPPPALAQARTALTSMMADAPPGTRVAVACSGGADSLAVAATLAHVGPRRGWQISAFIVDHDLHPDSAQVSVVAARQLIDLGFPHVTITRVTVAHGPGHGGPEAAARTARYAALDRLRTQHGVDVILLGHTRDDQAESVLLGLARGSGARSLSGIRPRTGHYVRPFLSLTRAATEEICSLHEVNVWHDPTNTDITPQGPLRSQVRGVVIPLMENVLGPGVADALARTADLLHADAEALEQWARTAQADVTITTTNTAEGQVHLDLTALAALPTAIRHRVLRATALAVGAPASAVSLRHIHALDHLITQWHGQGPTYLPGAISVRRQSGTLVFEPPTV